MSTFENGKLKYKGLQTREDYMSLMLDILSPLKKHYSEGCAKLYLGDTFAHYDIGATNMEAISRPLWALVPFWAGGGKENCVEGELDFAQIYHKALANGTNPNSEEYWGECTPFNQRFVEMAAISYGIMFAPSIVWDPLNKQEKDNLVNYLNKINEHELPVCNWILFAVLVNIALRKVGRSFDQDKLTIYLDGLETFYIGDGWYRDGDSNQKDYYISFAIHFYSLIYASVCEEMDYDRCKLYKERAMEFAKQFIYWFDDRGEAIPFGRSLTYRFAQVSFFSACLLAGIEPFPVPVIKGLIKRHLENWMDKSIFDRDGILTIGYGYPNLIMGERYNAPGSPYWGMKVFAFLILPEDHEFWSVEPDVYPRELVEKRISSQPCADMLIFHHGKHVTAYVPGVYSRFGHGHIVEKYSKFAYDTYTSINVARSQYELDEAAPNNMLAFFIDGYVYVRRQCSSSEVLEDRVISRWTVYPGVEVTTTVIPDDNGYTAVHEIESQMECEAYEFGFPVRRDDFEEVCNEFICEETFSEIKNKYMSCKVSGGQGHITYADPDTNLLYQRTALPGVKYEIKKGKNIVRTRVDLFVY